MANLNLITIRAMHEGTGPRHSTWQRRIAALLLVVQASVGSAVTLAHAAESAAGPITLEAHHTAQCVVLHDTARCAQCQFDATRIVPPATRQSASIDLVATHCTPQTVAEHAPTWRDIRTAPPRAPPLFLS
jgi:hypothetical protein